MDPQEFGSCVSYAWDGFRPIAGDRSERFLGKVEEDTARCRGGEKAVEGRSSPWVDWPQYWAAGDENTRAQGFAGLFGRFGPNGRGIRGALLDLEYQRMEMIKFNLYDNSGTYERFARGSPAPPAWPEMRLSPGYKETRDGPILYEAVGGDGEQLCPPAWRRFRTLTGICNDLKNPAMGSTGQPFARNVQFETTFPELEKDSLAKNRHGGRLGLLKPDPFEISRRLFARPPCQGETGERYSPDAVCDYRKAPFFNVLAAFWIQFMTHDWFSHLNEGRNRQTNGKPDLMDGLPIDKSLIGQENEPPTFPCENRHTAAARSTTCLSRAYKTTQNHVTAWWDASQIYGYDERSHSRVKRDPDDSAKLAMVRAGARQQQGEDQGYLPTLEALPDLNDEWQNQEATAFPDNWSIGLSFLHNVFAREHNQFVEQFRTEQREHPKKDSGLRRPDSPDRKVLYKDVTAEELFQIARLVVSAEIAKIHTIEWTTQLLYGEPLHEGMNANWGGLFRNYSLVSGALETVMDKVRESDNATKANLHYSAFSGGPGIFGLGNDTSLCWHLVFCPKWDVTNPDHVNGGTHHFGSPFNFPEEFITVYRLHPLLPDLIEYREVGKDEKGLEKDPNVIRHAIPVKETVRGAATGWMQTGKTLSHGRIDGGLANWGLSFGRQRLGLLTLENHPRFLQDLPMPIERTPAKRLDVAALDLIRDREHGVPRFNEFRRQYGLTSLRSFDDFVNQHDTNPDELKRQRRLAQTLRELYGTHICEESKVITSAQVNEKNELINDCLGYPNGTTVDNIEDLDTVVGWLAEPARPHGFAISETQFQVFILNASRRLFSDRFFTSSFRPEFYSHFGVDWVNNNGPGKKQWEKGRPNGHKQEVSPLKRVLLRTVPELEGELQHVVNAFDPWARDRGGYYSLQWKPLKGAESDTTFNHQQE